MENTTRSAQNVQSSATKKSIIVALVYDVDKTLISTNMQEFDLIPKRLSQTPNDFWNQSDSIALEQDADNNLAYMLLTLQLAKENGITKDELKSLGQKVPLFKGVKEWFERINRYGEKLGIQIEHYVISSGLSEMIEGMEIAKEFKKIYANRFMYDEKGIACWPARIMNYTGKTQALFRISKGCLQETDTSLNDRQEENRIPFKNFVYFGDGMTDVPCMAILQKHEGHCIGIYTDNKKTANKLLNDRRVNIIAPSDYSDGSKIDQYVKALLQKIKADENLASL